MSIIRTIAVAFAQYSRIPMPRFEWKEEDMRYSIAAFPLVGAVIGALFYAVFLCAEHFDIPEAAAGLLLTAAPVAVTGGFHIDGFMDVSDALSSYRSKEEKLAILKDPHIGAFAVIRLSLAGLVYIASMITVASSYKADRLIIAVAAGFVLARCLSALSVLTFRSAKNEGMLFYEASSAAGGRTANITAVLMIGAASASIMVYHARMAGAIMIAAALSGFAWYRYKSCREFGGITGDTAGWFVVICEVAVAAAAALSVLL